MKIFQSLVFGALLLSTLSAFSQQSAPTGFPPFGAFQNSEFDTVNVGSLNDHFEIPIVSKAGRGMPFVYKLVYDSSFWEAIQSTDAYGNISFTWSPKNVGYGWNIGSISGYVTYDTQKQRCDGLGDTLTQRINYAFHEPNGTVHPFGAAAIERNDCGGHTGGFPPNPALDGTGYTLAVDSSFHPTVTTPSGAVIAAPQTTPSSGYTLFGTGTITDSNGNQISGFTDTLGLSAITIGGTPSAGTYTYPSPTNPANLVGVTVNSTGYTLQTNFGCANVLSFEYGPQSVSLISSIVMPDGGTYVFGYEGTPGYPGSVTGRISSITLPSGGTISFTYTGGANGATCLPGSGNGVLGFMGGDPPVLTRTTPDGVWTYTRNATTSSPFSTTTIVDPKGNTDVITMYGANQTAYADYELKRQSYQGSSTGTLLRTIETCYNGNAFPCSANASFGVPISRKTVRTEWPDTTGSVSQTDTLFNTVGLVTRVTDVSEYDYGSGGPPTTPIRTTHTDYAALGNNIQDRPSVVTVKDGTGNILSQTTYGYDETAPTGTSGIPNHVAISGSRGNQTSVTQLIQGTTTRARTTSYYDTGTPNVVKDFNGNPTTYGYGSGSCGGAFPTSLTNALNQTVSATWDCNGAVKTSQTDANNQTTSFVFGDPNFWRPTATNYPDGGQVATTYNLASPPWSIVRTTKLDTSAPLVNTPLVDTTVYDTLGRARQTQLNSDPQGITYVDTSYDATGRVSTVSNPYRTTSDPTYGTIQTQYDGLGRVTQVTKQDGSISKFSYAGNCTTTTDEAGNPRKTCTDALGRLIEVDEPNAASSGTNATASVTISGALGSSSQPGSTPAAPGSALNSYLDAGGTGHVAYLNGNSHLINVSVKSAGPLQIQDLTALSGAAPATSGSKLANYGTLSTVLYEGSNQHIYQTFLYGSSWVTNDLTDMTGTSVVGAPGTAIISYSDSPNEHTFYLGTNNHVYELLWNGSTMSNLDLTALSGGAPAAAGSKLATYSAFSAVLYQGANQHIYDIFWSGSNWVSNDLTAMAGTSVVGTPGTAIISYLDSPNEHTFYLGTDNHVYELFWNGSSMSNLDLTALSAGAPAAAGSKLATYSAFSAVLYQGPNQHIYQTFLNGSTWVTNDLTAMAGTSMVGAAGTALSSYLDSPYEHTFYLGTDNHVYELLWTGTAMVNFDMSTSSPVTDSGTVSFSVGNFTATSCFGPSTNPSCSGQPENVSSGDIALALSRAFDSSVSPVSATASGATLNLIWKTPGTTTSTVSALSTADDNPSVFPNPSFTSPATNFVGGSGPSLSTNPYVTLYSYDALGNLLRVDQEGSAPKDSTQWRTRLFTYDSLSRLLTAYNPESGTISYSYDADGNLLQKTSPAPNQVGSATQTISYCYDALNRVTGKAYSAQTCTNGLLPSGTAAVSYTYDQGVNGVGHMTAVTDQAGSGSYSYDVMGRVASESRTISGITKNMSYGYNLDGSLASLTYPSTATVTYTPDAAGRMLSAIDNGNGINYATAATYDATSALTGFVSGKSGSFAGITSSFSFNKRLQPVFMSAGTPTNTVFSIGYDFHLGSGDNGNVYSLTNNRDHTRDQSFTYDALNRLISAQNAGTDCTQKTLNSNQTKFWGNIYGYDAWGNLVSKDVAKCSAETLDTTALANNRLSGYGYDAAGNMTYDATRDNNYTYDPENRIVGAAGFTYTYDDDGNRVKKSNGSTGTLYWYMTLGIVAESDLSGNLQSEYVFFDGERIARKDFPSNAVSYYFSDHLKTTNIVTDAQGNILNESDYYPWGGELQFLANDSNHYKFAGKERDVTGLDYFGARYYSQALGRFVTPDPGNLSAVFHMDDPQAWNGYTYVRNNPTSVVDPEGMNYIVCQSVPNSGTGNCVDLTDGQYEQFLKESPRLHTTAGGDIYVTNDNGSQTKVGTEAYYNEKDKLAAGFIAGHEALIYQLYLRSVRDGVTGGVFGIAAGELASGLTEGLGYIAPRALGQLTGNAAFTAERLSMLRPLVTNPELEGIVNELYQTTDKIAGGTAAAVRYERMTGNLLSPAGHGQEAADIVRQLTNFLKNAPNISTNDQAIAKELIRDLVNAGTGH